MKKNIVIDIVCLLLIVTVIGIPIAIYILRKNEDYGKSDNILKPSTEVKEKKYEEEKRKFTPLYTETTILPVLTEEDLKKYKKEIKEEVTTKKETKKKEVKEEVVPKKEIKKKEVKEEVVPKKEVKKKETKEKVTLNKGVNKKRDTKKTNNKKYVSKKTYNTKKKANYKKSTTSSKKKTKKKGV